MNSTIPTNFRVPPDCRHEWVLFHENGVIGTLHGIPGKKQIHQAFREPANCSDDRKKLVFNLSLDWIAESVEHLRFICKG